MKKSKLIFLLSSLQEVEWVNLKAFVASPYFNKDKTVISLLQIIEKQFQQRATLAALDKKELAALLWPSTAYSAKKFTYVVSRLNKLAEHYLAIERVRRSEFELELTALEIFSERGLNKHYQAGKRQIKKQLNQTGDSLFSVFKTQTRFAEIEDQHYIRLKRRVHDLSIQEAALHLDRAYYLQRLHQACSMLDRQHILQATYNTAISEAWIAHLQTHDAGREPIIRLYLDIFEMLSVEEEEIRFASFKYHLAQYQENISPKDFAEIYQFAINYCARKIRAGEEKYVDEALQLYLLAIKAGWFIINGQLSPWTYANVVKLFLRKKEFDEAKAFIHQYLPLLPANFRENAFHYNLAELYYYTNLYGKAQEHLVQVAYSDLNYYLGARVLLAKIYFQTGAEDALSSLLAAFIMFLQRNKQLSRNLKSTYLNFCKILARILRTTQSKQARLIEDVKNTALLTDRDWLLEIIKQK